jgi:hypothetical protein
MDAPTEGRLQTRMTNKEQHPGQVTYTASGRAKRRTKAEMEAYRLEQETKKREAKEKKNAVVMRIAQLEGDMAIQDKKSGRAHPRSRKGHVFFFFVLLIRYGI